MFFPSVCPMIIQKKSILIDLMIMYNLIPLNFFSNFRRVCGIMLFNSSRIAKDFISL